jgi:aryl-alcohol dehydrogenase-like predicted oxidoreductase
VKKMAADDWRRGAAEFNEPYLSRNLALRDALRPVAERHDATVSSVALAWTLVWPGVTGAIVGARTPAQVDGWIQAASLKLTDPDLEEIGVAVQRTNAGAGLIHPKEWNLSAKAHLA